LDTWRALEELVDAGQIRSIGLSNFNLEQMARVWVNARIQPSNVQVYVQDTTTDLIYFSGAVIYVTERSRASDRRFLSVYTPHFSLQSEDEILSAFRS